MDRDLYVEKIPFVIRPQGKIKFNLESFEGPLDKITKIDIQWDSIEAGGCFDLIPPSTDKYIIPKHIVLADMYDGVRRFDSFPVSDAKLYVESHPQNNVLTFNPVK